MKLSDLNSIKLSDVKNNIDLHKIREIVQKRPELLINFFLITITLVIVIFSFGNRKNDSNALKSKITALEEKSAAIKEQETSINELNDYIKNFPKGISSENLVNYLTELAAPRNIEINSVLPAKKVNKQLYDLTTLQLQITAKDYNELIHFIYEVESSPYALRIGQITTALGSNYNPSRRSRSQSQDQSGSEPQLKINMRIDIIELTK